MYSLPVFESNDFNFERNFISAYDYILLFPYLILFFLIGIYVRDKYFKNHPGKNYFIPALTFKLLGGIFICLLYNYYYGGGDTTAYFNDARLLNKVLFHHPPTAVKIFTSSPKELLQSIDVVFHNFRFLRADSTSMVVRIAAFLQLFTFNSFLVTSAFFGFLSFFAMWYFYTAMCKSYPKLYKQFSYATLFVPSIIVWGSGIFKDTICLSLLVIIYAFMQNIIARKKANLLSVAIIALSVYLILIIKVYIILIFVFSFALFFIFGSIKSIKNKVLRFLLAPFLVLVGVFGFYVLVKTIGDSSKKERYSMDNILDTAEITGHYLQYVSGKGNTSGYSLGEVEYTPVGILKKLPAGINVTLFRPYLWEVKKVIMLFSAVESFMLLIFTIYVILKNGIFKVTQVASNNILAISFLIYSLIFSFAIGITTFNFGSLVRYKIPILPFYILALIIINYEATKPKRA